MTWLPILIAYGLPIAALLYGGWKLRQTFTRTRTPDLVKAPPKTVYTFPPERGNWNREKDETLMVDQYRPERLHGLIELQKRTTR